MDGDYYSQKTINNFIKKTVCHGDAILLKYYQDGKIKSFRRRLEILKVNPKDIQKIIYTYVTDTIRDIILDTIGNLTKYMEPMGDMIISGGEAFNFYFDIDSRVVTSDIDTKFVPRFRKKNFFENLQATKLILWEKLGRTAIDIERKIIERLNSTKNMITRMYGISLPNSTPVVTRRYTLIRKKKQSANRVSAVTPENVLIDVELFTLDLKIRYFSTQDDKISERNLGGILDIALMRPGELGYDVAFDRQRGYTYRNTNTKKFKYNPNIIIASKRFLLEDLYLMQSLGLRPEKKEKDRKRMYNFATKILGLKNVNTNDTIYDIFLKSVKVLPMKSKTKQIVKDLPKSILNRAERINPYNYQNRTTQPLKTKVIGQFLVGFKGPRGLTVKGIKETSGPFRFDVTKEKWVRNNSTNYVKNEFNYRPNNKFSSNINVNELKPTNILYGYNPRRNYKMSEKIIQAASMIPLIGLKDLNIV
jgi:hypothetical protein